MRIQLIILFILLISSGKVFCGYASLAVSDTSILIGAPNEINLTIHIPQNYAVQIPNIILPDNIFLLKKHIDTTYDAGLMKIIYKFVITSFVEASYIIPETKIIFTNINNNNISIETLSPLKIEYLYPKVDTNRPYFNFYDKIFANQNTISYSNQNYLYVFFIVLFLLLIFAVAIKYYKRKRIKDNYTKTLQKILRNINKYSENDLVMSVNCVLVHFLINQIGLNYSEMNTNNIKLELSKKFEINDLTGFINIKIKIEHILYNNGHISKDEINLIINNLVKILNKYCR